MPARNETHIRAHVLARLPILCAERLRGAVVLSVAFEPADDDHVTRGYVAWQRSDQCGTHALTVHLRAVPVGRGSLLMVGQSMNELKLHSGHYNMTAGAALADAAARVSSAYAETPPTADEQGPTFLIPAIYRVPATDDPNDAWEAFTQTSPAQDPRAVFCGGPRIDTGCETFNVDVYDADGSTSDLLPDVETD